MKGAQDALSATVAALRSGNRRQVTADNGVTILDVVDSRRTQALGLAPAARRVG